MRLPLVGAFQIENAAVAAGLAIATGGAPRLVFAALENLVGAKGRLEFAGERNGAPIFIDYAHKPDALQKAIEALRPYVSGKLTVIFGAGGVLPYGSSASQGDFVCRMRESGVECLNVGTGHGFVLARESTRRF